MVSGKTVTMSRIVTKFSVTKSRIHCILLLYVIQMVQLSFLQSSRCSRSKGVFFQGDKWLDLPTTRKVLKGAEKVPRKTFFDSH